MREKKAEDSITIKLLLESIRLSYLFLATSRF